MSDVSTIDPTTVALWEYQGRGNLEGEVSWGRRDIESVIERVNRGAQLLDTKKPRWNFDVIPEKLDMSSSTFCIVGQTYGNYDEFVGPLFGQGAFDDPDESAEHGFMADSEEWPLLDRVWAYLLQDRSESGSPSLLGALPPAEPANVALQRLKDNDLL